MSDKTSFFGAKPTTDLLAINDPAGRPLLALNVVDGNVVATYDPADLDRAAQALVEVLTQAHRAHRWDLT